MDAASGLIAGKDAPAYLPARPVFQNIQSGQNVWPGTFQGIGLRLIPYFAELGDAIEDAWRGAGGGLPRFPAIACRQLEHRPPFASVSVATILDWFFAARPSVEQSENASFGQPPIKLYQGSDFYIEALFWMTATTSIHQHGFAGAFTPLAGASVCSTFRYAVDRQVEPGFSLGTLERVHTEILRPGAVRPIHAGPGLIHQLFHLDRPTVTIVVRTPADPQSLPQLAYLPPGLAMDGLRDDPVVSRQLRLLGVMIDSGVADVEAHAARILAQPAVAPAYRVLAYLVARAIDSVMIDKLLAVFERAHPGLGARLYQAACNQRRIALITQLRETVSDPELRFFLALLMLLGDREIIFQLIATEQPGCDPVERIITWLHRLSGVDRVGIEFGDLETAIFRALLRGCDVPAVLASLTDEYEPDEIAHNHPALVDHITRIASSEIFAPLFCSSTSHVQSPSN